jgi:two-component system, cell cycle sensor histidine kinase and response regulator CckA
VPPNSLSGAPLRLLLVEDNDDDAELVLAELTLAGFDVDYQRVDDEAGFLKHLNPSLDIILSDYTLPRFNAGRTLTLLRESGYSIPCIVVTGSVGEEAAVACMRQGASDYLLKDRLSRLGTAVAQAIEGRRLREARAQLAAIAEWSNDAIIALTADGRITTWNRGAEMLYGYRADEVRGQPVTVLVEKDRTAELVQVLNEVRHGHREQQRETVSVTKDGRSLEVSASFFPVLDEEGEPVSAAAIIRDMSAERERQRQTAQAERLRALGQLAGGVAHDLNQSLALILGYSDLVRNALTTSADDLAEVVEMLTIISQAAADGGETVKRLLTFARNKTETETAPVEVTALLNDVALLTAPRWRDASQAEGRSITLNVNAEPGLVMLGSQPHLREMLTNLIFNAVDALPTGGTIRLLARAEGDQILIAVEDSGVGMPRDVQERVFEPFYTTKGERGTGLGLPLVLGIVKSHGGAIQVLSSPGHGTTFAMKFARAREEDAAGKAGPANATATRSLRILAVDDEPNIVRMLSLMLNDQQIVTATSGEEALRLISTALDDQKPFDVLMTDIGLGRGMTGWELAERVRAIQPSLAVVLVSGWGASIDEADERRQWVHAIIAKPFRNAEIRRVLASVGSREQAPA